MYKHDLTELFNLLEWKNNQSKVLKNSSEKVNPIKIISQFIKHKFAIKQCSAHFFAKKKSKLVQNKKNDNNL